MPVNPPGVAAALTPAPAADNSGLPAPLTDQQVMDQARQAIENQIQGQVTPLQGQIDALGTQRDRTLQGVGSMFDALQPVVTQSAQAVDQSYRDAETTQNGIFAAANQRLNQLKQDRASEAQRLAQQIGGPVAVGEFTAGLDPMIEAGTLLGAGQQLHTLGYAQAGNQQAQAFAGQVFPLVRSEETAKARNYFEDQIKDLRGQIDKIQATKGSLIDSKQADLHQQNLQYQLQVAQQKLDNVKANRDWQATLRSLKNDEARITLAKNQFGLDTKKTNADITNASAADKRAAAAQGLSVKEFKAQQVQQAASRRLATQKLDAAKKTTYAEFLDAAVNPQPGKTITSTQAVPTQAPLPGQKVPGDTYQGNDGKWYKLIKTVQTATMQPITDPGALVDYLVAHGQPKASAIAAVKARLRMPNWVYGSGGTTATVTGVGKSRH